MSIQGLGGQPFVAQQARPSGYFGPAQIGGGSFFPGNIVQLLGTLLSALSQLSQGWGGFAGGGVPGGGGYPGPSPYPGGGGGYPVYGGGGGYPVYGGGGGFPQTGGIAPPFPSDPNEFASYLQAQVAGGALQGRTGISQGDAIPGTRFGRVQDPSLWSAGLARDYAYQFAAYAAGADPLTPQGMAYGANAFSQMAPDAQLFMQVASVFKGNKFGGPGNYNNPGLKNLLLSRGLGNLANRPGVGQSDVQTIGAITQALNSGALSLNDVINSGTIDNLSRYSTIIQYVQGGGFAQELRAYDSVPV
ncbi:MAG: hypothetical protein AB7S38_06880 [Vulcanimicrobiota bacterium]